MDKINPEYKNQIEQIKLDGEEYTDEQMKEVYKMQKSKLDELHVLIGLLFVKYAVDGLLKLGRALKSKLLDEVSSKLKTIGKDLGQTEVNKVTDILSKVYEDTYYKSAFVMDEGMEADLKFNLLKKEYIDAAVNQKFKGELFSDRIWKNKADMIDKLKSSIIDCMNGNTTVDKIGKDIQKTFNVSAYESQRLVRTEMARVQTQASLDIAKNTGVKEVMWDATLDMKTNPKDAELDGKVWNIDEEHPSPPLHPNCRCHLINVPFAGWKPSKRKDNETKKIIDYMDYKEWKKRRVDNEIAISKDEKDEKDDIISSKEWLKANFSSQKRFESHFKHLSEYGNISPEKYLNIARNLLASDLSEDIEGFISNQGWVFKYRKSTNDFVMGHPKGTISTLFKPKEKYDYFLSEKEKYK